MTDADYMAQALALAERGAGWTSPNPMVGAVIVRDGAVLGEGWHARCGGPHAERAALAACAGDPRGATMYVTLEPCCHTGRQPPCTQAILDAGIRRVVVGSGDPNPLVAGKGLQALRAGGVEVETGALQEACDALNAPFFHFIRTRRPYVVLKYAMTLDGRTATRTGASQWITGEAARRRVHESRHRLRSILVGVGTVLADDPLLTCRIEGGRDPLRVVCDTHLRTPLDSRLLRTAGAVETVLATCVGDPERLAPYAAAGCQVWTLPERGGRVDLAALMDRLGAAEVDSLLLEGGSTLSWAMLEAGLVQRVQAYVAPKLFGGAAAPGPVGGLGVEAPDQAIRLRHMALSQVGEDLLLEGEVETDVHGAR